MCAAPAGEVEQRSDAERDSEALIRTRVVLVICCMASCVTAVDTTIINVALPSIQREFRASIADTQWTIDSYVFVIGCLLAASGSAADRFGRLRIFQLGLLTFTIGSLLCSVAPRLEWLVVFRMVQAAGGSMLVPGGLSIITGVFTDSKGRARALGVWGGMAGVSLAIGPVLGGVLVQHIGWRSIFWVNIAPGFIAITLAARFVPESKAAHARRFDPIGQLLLIGLLGALLYAIIEAPSLGWVSPPILVGLIAAGVGLIAFWLYESRRDEPFVDPRFFRSAPFAGANIINVCAYGAYAGFVFLNTFYLQDVLHYSPEQAGLSFLPLAAVFAVSAVAAGWAVSRCGPRPVLLAAGPAIVAGALLFAAQAAHPSDARLFASYALIGLGMGGLNPTVANTAIAGMPPAQAGVASAINSTGRQVGQAIGVAVIGTVIASYVRRVAPGVAFTDAVRTSCQIVAGCGLVTLLLGIVTSSLWAERTAKRNAARMSASLADGAVSLPTESGATWSSRSE